MGLIWRLATPTSEDREARKRDGSEYRWSDYLSKICAIILSRHANAVLIILVNDRYDLPFSIKDDEHDRRAAKHPHIPNVFPKPEDRFPGAAEFNKLMVNSGNKLQGDLLIKRKHAFINCRGMLTEEVADIIIPLHVITGSEDSMGMGRRRCWRRKSRKNFIAYCQLHYNLFEHPSPIGHGWELVNGKCRPVRHTLPPLPQQLTLHDCPDESSDDERKIQVDLPDPLSNFPETPPSCSLDPSCSMDITHANVKHPIGRTSCNCHT
ncbi:hypothetical protein SKAU_G00017130 [Synaphobranchus kaupii]|uniref:Uncharacterized protein n=1 Tax=Synaphobranchus kaupii TaxID=118154 RepID=A0A9Q1GCC1_SYNKA|nr:hypothetical protein SKAU_G00017130 [Synaphobranchus kaupii]